MPLGVQRVHGQRILPRNHPLLMRIIVGEYRGSRDHVCAVSVGNHPWPYCAVTLRWRGCLPVVIRTCISVFLCLLFRPVIVRSNRTYRSYPEGARTMMTIYSNRPRGVFK
jgi:hypothetical protein